MKICVAIKAKNTRHCLRKIANAGDADIIELRVDYREGRLDLEKIRKSTDKPLIATNRRIDQGGKSEETEEKRIELLLDAAEVGFDLIDLGISTEQLDQRVKDIQKKGTGVIVSYHDFENPLKASQLYEIHRLLSATGCDYVKIIGWANSYDDNLPYLEYNNIHPGNIAFAMGEKGTPSRVMAPLSGAAYTYASLDEAVAPGQIELKALRATYRSLRL